ncbi:nucleoside triphosphate pyrophosphohydrolase [Actinomadura sp. WAC 06369]|uniref:nucleoside triphosphate pyrophosphohydrolase n=1 Tax=Actinomadura sp. WAC 06369 TaxID=2203193 RepID=UPI001F42FA08|nr:nucleoside triphosphate pyrophosphohydrolase [Actinomadura sp. WAC 06369]
MDESLQKVLADVAAERDAQERTWGVQDFPDGTGPAFTERADQSKRDCADAAASGELAWRHILAEEFSEALAESDLVLLRGELVQTAAVAVQWIQALDRRNGGGAPAEKLVRDRIPEIITGSGRTPQTRIAGQDEYTSLLRAKLSEEVTEYTADADPDELADILEVVHALAAVHGLSPGDLERRRAAKAAERGGFTRRVVLRLPPPEGD